LIPIQLELPLSGMFMKKFFGYGGYYTGQHNNVIREKLSPDGVRQARYRQHGNSQQYQFHVIRRYSRYELRYTSHYRLSCHLNASVEEKAW